MNRRGSRHGFESRFAYVLGSHEADALRHNGIPVLT